MPLIAAGSREWDGLIVLCAANGYDGIRMSDWHLAQHLSRLAPVLYVDPPMSRLTPKRKPEPFALGRPRLRLQGPGLARLTPVVQPFPTRPGATRVTTALTRRYLRRATDRLGGRVLAVISCWAQFLVFGSCQEQISVYWAKDDFVGGADLLGLNAKVLDKCERRVAASADLLVAANPVVAATWSGRGIDPLLIPFGTDAEAFAAIEHAPLPPDVDLPGPVVGFVGRINDRTDLGLLEAIAQRGRSLLLVGPKDPAFEPERFETLSRRHNVRWVGLKRSEELPGYLRVMDVGVVPYTDSRFNQGSFPLKTLEYLAAGRAVVATDLPAIRMLATDLICIAEPASFADQVDRLLAEPRTEAVLACRQAFAARHSWARRAGDIREAIASRQCRPDAKIVLR
jgi:teichuronic acid biosynthesis glycosyltransferase TuaH